MEVLTGTPVALFHSSPAIGADSVYVNVYPY